MAEVTLNELEFAGAMKFRFVDVSEDDYQDGIDFVPNTVNLNRFQTVLANVDGTGAETANYHSEEDEIKVFADDGEIVNGSSVDLTVVAIGR